MISEKDSFLNRVGLPPFDRARIREKLLQKPTPAIAVVGDFCLDKYLFIDAKDDEPSVETGLTAYQVRRKGIYPGAAGTVANNLTALGAKVFAVGICGNDGEGHELVRELQKIGVETGGIVRSDRIVTSTYIKPMRKEIGSSEWREMNRIDIRNSRPAPEEMVRSVIDRLEGIIPKCSAVVITDQFTLEAGSVLTNPLRDYLGKTAAKRSDLFFMVDSRSNAEEYRNVVVKCNASEILDLRRRASDPDSEKRVAADLDADQKESEILDAGRWLTSRNQKPVLVTRGALGSLLFDGEAILSVPAYPVSPPIDICGAGDATSAGLAYGRAIGLPLSDAALVAGIVSSITIEQIGVTGTADIDRILRRLGE